MIKLSDYRIYEIIKEDILKIVNDSDIYSFEDYLKKYYEMEDCSLEEALGSKCAEDLASFRESPLNQKKLEITDGKWQAIKIVRNAQSARHYFDMERNRKEQTIYFVQEVTTGFWTTNSQLLFKELNLLNTNPYRAIPGWQDSEELLEIYILHRISMIF